MQDCLATSLKVETWGYKTSKFHFHGKPHHTNTSALNNGRDMIHLPALLDNLVGLWSQLYTFCSCQAVAIWRIHRHADGCATNAPGPFPEVAVARPGIRVPPIIIHFVRVQASRSASQHTEVHWQSAVWWIAGARQDLLSGHLSLKMPFFSFPKNRQNSSGPATARRWKKPQIRCARFASSSWNRNQVSNQLWAVTCLSETKRKVHVFQFRLRLRLKTSVKSKQCG